MRLGTGVLGVTYRTTGVTFDGTNDFLSRGTGLGADGERGTLSVWLKFNGGDGTLIRIIDIPQGFFLEKIASNLIEVVGQTSSATTILRIITNTAVTSSSGWVHVLASWDLAANVSHLYLNGVADQTVTTRTNNTINYLSSDCTIGAQTVGALFKFNGDMADLYLNTAEYLDLSVAANRAKFARGGRPVDLGPDGSLPTGSQPTIFLKGPAVSFATNLGSGGNFTVSGALTDAATPPKY